MLKTYEIKTEISVTDTASGKTYVRVFSTVALYHSASQGQPVSFEAKGEEILNYLYQDNQIGRKLKSTITIKETRKGRKVHTILDFWDDDSERVVCWLGNCAIHFERTVQETSLTLKKMVETFKADEVIEYCVERGLGYLPGYIPQ